MSINVETIKVGLAQVVAILLACFSLYVFILDAIEQAKLEAQLMRS